MNPQMMHQYPPMEAQFMPQYPPMLPQFDPQWITQMQEKEQEHAKQPQDVGKPCKTVYIKNLNESIGKQELKEHIKRYFEKFGEVEEVKLWRNIRMRGQAFVKYKSIESAEQAVKCMPGFLLFNKPMVVMFAKTDSLSPGNDSDGTVKTERDQTKEERQQRFQYVKTHVQQLGIEGIEQRKHNPLMFPPKVKNNLYDELLPPFRILYVQNIDLSHDVEECTVEKLKQQQSKFLADLFKQYPGFVAVHLLNSNTNCAFVEYKTEYDAMPAKQDLDGHIISPSKLLKITYARR